MCFAPRRRTLFRHLNFQKWSGAGVNCTFWLGNVLRATTHFFHISTPKSGPNVTVFHTFYFQICFAPRRRAIFHFSSTQAYFWPSGATKHWKHTVFRDFPTFSHTCIFPLVTFCLSDLLSSDFHPVWASSWLCFSIFRYYRKLSF